MGCSVVNTWREAPPAVQAKGKTIAMVIFGGGLCLYMSLKDRAKRAQTNGRKIKCSILWNKPSCLPCKRSMTSSAGGAFSD
jgi:hypothetical protein